jgi:uncharacterized protein YndB with AHSA1/START domain
MRKAVLFQRIERQRKSARTGTGESLTYIRTTPEKLWSALTNDVEFMKQYWFGTHCESEWTPGSSWMMVYPDGAISDSGVRSSRLSRHASW